MHSATGGPVEHILDWFHLSMRVRHVELALLGLSALEPTHRGPLDTAQVDGERLRHLLWNSYHEEVCEALGRIASWAEDAARLNGAAVEVSTPDASSRGARSCAPTRHGPIQVIESPSDEQVDIALACGQAVINGETIAPDQARDDGVTVPDWLAIIHNIGQLSTRSMPKREAAQLQKGEDLETLWIVIGDTEQIRVGEQGQHGGVLHVSWMRAGSISRLKPLSRGASQRCGLWRLAHA